MENLAPSIVEKKPPLTLLTQVVSDIGPVKPSIKTGELWLLVAVLGAIFALAFEDKLPPQFAAIIAPIAALVFQFARQSLKSDHRDSLTSLTELLLDHTSYLALSGSRTEIPTPSRAEAPETARPILAPNGAEPVAPSGGSVSESEQVAIEEIRPPGSGAGVGPKGGFAIPDVVFALACAVALIVIAAAHWTFTAGKNHEDTKTRRGNEGSANPQNFVPSSIRGESTSAPAFRAAVNLRTE